MKTKVLFIIALFLMVNLTTKAQYDCGSATTINALSYSAGNLQTSSGASFDVSNFCGQNTGYAEKSYIFKYIPPVDQAIQVVVTFAGTSSNRGGIYVFNDCGDDPQQCVAFIESTADDEVVSDFIALASETYYIFIGTEDPSQFFNVEITSEEVQGVAINKSEPTQTLDVNGAVRIGTNTTTPYAGTIRWNEDIEEFEGYNGTEWVLLSPKKEFGQTVKVGQSAIASDGAAGDNFGFSVSISGDYAVVGSHWHNTNGNSNQGKAYVYRRSGTSWVQEDILIATDGANGDEFGRSVSISGDYAVVGSYRHNTNGNSDQGKAYVYRRSGTSWVQEDMLIASDGAASDNFGFSVSISGDYVVVGSNLHDTNGNLLQGKAYVYRRSGTSWVQEDMLIASDGAASDNFGRSVSISGDYAVVGSSLHNTNGNSDQGKAYVYRRSGTSWVQEDMLIASDGAASDNFGFSVSISGDYAVVGSYLHDTNGNSNQGKAYVYRRYGTLWIQVDILIASDGAAFDNFGVSVSISGDYAVVGSYSHDTNGNSDQGKAYVYRRSGTSWVQEDALIASDAATGDRFGVSVSISGDHVVVGSPWHATNGNGTRGKVYFY